MKDWRTAENAEELLAYIESNIRIEQIIESLSDVNGFTLNDIEHLPVFDSKTGEHVLEILLEFACYSQNMLCIELGRKCVSFIPKDWLRLHITNTVKKYFKYDDDWNYRRLLELTNMIIPDMIGAIIDLNKNSDDPDILECLEDFI